MNEALRFENYVLKQRVKELEQEKKMLRLDFEIRLKNHNWIPVSDRLPESCVNVLFCDIDGDVMLGYHIPETPKTHFVEKGSWDMVKNVIAWMPLPESYKAESEDKE